MIHQSSDNRYTNLAATIQRYLETLCVQIPNRHVGSPGNREATTFFANTIAAFGFTTECPEFDCIDWEYGSRSAGIGIVALNGEDYYAAAGQIQYLSMYAATFEQVQLAINLDGVGYHNGRTAFSLYGCPPELTERIRQTFRARPELYEGFAKQSRRFLELASSRTPRNDTHFLDKKDLLKKISTLPDCYESSYHVVGFFGRDVLLQRSHFSGFLCVSASLRENSKLS